MGNGFRFQHGQYCMMPSVNDLVADNDDFAKFALTSLRRHFACDWGDMNATDKNANNQALIHGGRLFSAYENPLHPEWKLWIITEADRSATTMMFPSDY